MKLYLEKEWLDIKNNDYNGKKQEELLKLLNKVYEMQLLNTAELAVWEERLCSVECEDIHALGLSRRSESQLRHAGIKSCGALRKLIKGEHIKKNILNLRNVGPVTALEIVQKAVSFGLVQKEEVYENPSKGVAWINFLEQFRQANEH